MLNKSLLEKIAAGTASPQETAQFQQWLQTLKETDLREAMRAWETTLPQPMAAPQGDEAVLQQITQTLQQQGALLHTHKRSGGRLRALGWSTAVAAAILLVVAAGTWLLITPKDQPSSPVIAAADKAPATGRATLTLASGKVIELNNNTNGTVAREGGITIVKLDSGQIAYQPDITAGDDAAGWNTLSTPKGGLFQVVLPDGTKVWLNAASSLRYPSRFTGANRTVTLAGEAYFEVAANKAMPFIVTTQQQQVQVLGTAFNINAYSDEDATRTTLLQGSVRVQTTTAGNASCLLTPAQQAVVNTGGLTVTSPDMQQVMAWKEGEFRFQHMKITSIMRQIARWYDVEVEYSGPVPGNEFYGVIPRKEYVSQILKALSLTKNVHFIMRGNTIVVMAGPA
ncbi:FecR family protein [Filimonas lacunae]|uniref:FecR family protein n=1 Tax=Filimonas lacunae TaxID=477680 RepID=A0A173MIB8_9BACT|nr:FecR family protein [Filimonas lacunae]BAV07364.1 anti-sigma factor [Filimonas lacunae]SIS90702.1 FecR family protein [Filimonas lacunae]